MSENRPTPAAVQIHSSLQIVALTAATALLLGSPGIVTAAGGDEYVAPLRAPQAWLERLTSEDRSPLEAWTTFLAPPFDEQLRWIGPDGMREPNPPRWSDLYGTVVVLQSWSNADEASVARLEEVAQIVGEFSDIDVQLIGLHTPLGATAAPEFIQGRERWSLLTAVDMRGKFLDLLGVYRTPVNIVVDRNGTIRYAGLTPDGLREAIDHLLDEDAHAAPCRGSRTIGDVEPVIISGDVDYPRHNPQPRARNLQGQRAPDFFVQSWANHEPDQIEGRVNVIKFWRTGCPHCINAIPKTDELAQKYAGRVNFIGITNENHAAMVQGLNQRRRPLETIRHHIAIDTSRRMNQAVGPQGVPNAMIVDSNWIVRWQGHPAGITEQLLDQVLEADSAGGTAPPAESRTDSLAGYPPHNPQPRARNLQGQPAPEIFVQSWANHEPEQIEGRVNVIKFWRTGCPHCINAIPKTDELAQKYAGRVNFIGITNENHAAMVQGLNQRRRPLETIQHHIAIDTSRRMHQAVSPQGVPNAMVIDSNGIVRWQGHPNGIDEILLDRILHADGLGGPPAAIGRWAAEVSVHGLRAVTQRAQPGDAPRWEGEIPTTPRVRQPPQQQRQQGTNVQRRNVEFGPADFPPKVGDIRAEFDLRGQPAPEFHAEQWVSARPLGLGEKVTLIEFFRTNCPHCRNAIPKLNELNLQFAGLVDIITLSSEQRGTFDEGLTRHRLTPRSFNHFVALDPSMKMFNAFRPRGVPYAVILDSNWIVRWQGHPNNITAELLEQIIVADAWQRRQRG